MEELLILSLLGGAWLGVLVLARHLQRQAKRWDKSWLERELRRRAVDVETFYQGMVAEARRATLVARFTQFLLSLTLGGAVLMLGLLIGGHAHLRTVWLFLALGVASGAGYAVCRLLGRWFQQCAERIHDLTRESPT